MPVRSGRTRGKRRSEPRRLSAGKAFHTRVQETWMRTAEGEVLPEEVVPKSTGKMGRVDILVDPAKRMVTVVEIKASDWDRMKEHRLRPNIRRQIRQVWDYLGPYLDKGSDVCAGMVFKRRPKDLDRLRLIEDLFNEEGLQVVWEDETIAEARRRHSADGTG